MPNDGDLINFSQEHELNYILHTHLQRSQSQANRELLLKIGSDYKSAKKVARAKHEKAFYDYAKAHRAFGQMTRP
ncbi:hypothetical protein [Acerihabitans sp.]|uniref:hypothetical protein n=1 Tax=Acerihabitans sp. TaxID=2811394 RepID=UPI002EDB0AFF